MRLPPPNELRNDTSCDLAIAHNRKEAISLLQGQQKKWIVFVGPCSIHDLDSSYEYACRLQQLMQKLTHIQLFMRVFLEKPRTHKGWTGLIYDPYLDASFEITQGLKLARQLLISITKLNIPCVTELLEPLLVPYFEDLLSWGMIGARTSASQPHRQLASSLSFPVGFKNCIHGELDPAIFGILAARESQFHIQIDHEGRIGASKTEGNPWAHLVLRGAETHTNYAPYDVQKAIETCMKYHILPRILIDCSHGNSSKDYTKQPKVLDAVVQQIEQGNLAIFGAMLESHLLSGKQPIHNIPLNYGMSVTDSCLGFSETEELLLQMDARLGKIDSVQKCCSHTST